MRKPAIIIITLAAIAVVQLARYSKRRQQTKQILHLVADAGYETAEDILFPLKSQRISKRYRQ
jgi:hypothetical protein